MNLIGVSTEVSSFGHPTGHPKIEREKKETPLCHSNNGCRISSFQFFLLVVLLAAGCSKAPQAPEDKTPQVDFTTPVTGTVTDYEDFTGRLDALKTTDIRAHVSGYILKAPFKEGDEVREGAVLFEIDPRTYEADFNQ